MVSKVPLSCTILPVILSDENHLRELIQKLNTIWDNNRALRFLCVGVLNTILDFTLLNILYEIVGLSILVANTISVSIGITISYFLNHRVVFRHSQQTSLTSYGHFFLITGISVLIVQNLVIYIVTHLFKVGSTATTEIMSINIKTTTLELNISKAIAVVIGAVWNYLLYKFIVFPSDTEDNMADEILVV
jgi:putative flippase GtrA